MDPTATRRSRRDKDSSGGGHHREGTWPKQQPGYADDDHGGYTQDDHNVQYLQDLEENARLIQGWLPDGYS